MSIKFISQGGIDTSDANAQAQDILEDKSAYVNGNKVDGTMPNNGDVVITPTKEQITKPKGYYNTLQVKGVTSDIDPNIIPSNIRTGVTILGVTGTLEEKINTSDANATAMDILVSKSAYVNDIKVIGELEPNNSNALYVAPSGTSISAATMLSEIDFSNIDTSRVTSMNNAYLGYSSLTKIKNLNTSNVTTMVNTFGNCLALETAPNMDTSKVTDMNNMFGVCTKLKNIPNYDVSSVNDAHSMFYRCSSLETAPEFNFVAAKKVNNLFECCSKLTNVSTNLKFPAAVNLTKVFQSCPLLSDNSLNNIMQICIEATKVGSSYKTLGDIGLSAAQIERCTALPNYQALLDAGWTTGV